MLIFTKIIYIYLTVRELCHHQNPSQFSFPHQHYCLFFIPLLFPVYPTLLWLTLKRSWWVLTDDGAWSKRAAELFRSAHTILIPGLALMRHSTSTKNKQVSWSQREKRESSVTECHESPRDTLIRRGQERVLRACEWSQYAIKVPLCYLYNRNVKIQYIFGGIQNANSNS